MLMFMYEQSGSSYTRACTRMHTYACICVRACVHACMRAYMRAYVHTSLTGEYELSGAGVLRKLS